MQEACTVDSSQGHEWDIVLAADAMSRGCLIERAIHLFNEFKRVKSNWYMSDNPA